MSETGRTAYDLQNQPSVFMFLLNTPLRVTVVDMARISLVTVFIGYGDLDKETLKTLIREKDKLASMAHIFYFSLTGKGGAGPPDYCS